jgi:Bacterial Ig domain
MSLYAVATPPPPTSDTNPPTVAIANPGNGSYVAGTVAITANASDNVGVTRVDFYLDRAGGTLIGSDSSSPYSVSWNTVAVAAGPHTLYAVARDAAGNTATSAPVPVTVDNEPPTVAISSPAGGSHVSGNVSVTANAGDDFSLVRVDFYRDSATLIGSATTTPYSIVWDASSVSTGSHTLYAIAKDAAGNTAMSANVQVTVDTLTPPQVTITSPPDRSSVQRKSVVAITATATAGSNQVHHVDFLVGTTPVCSTVTSTTTTYTCNWTVPAAGNRTYQIHANAYDTLGNAGSSNLVTVTSR